MGNGGHGGIRGRHGGVLPRYVPAAAVSILCSPVAGTFLLFEGPGYSATYRNTWAGWYEAGDTVPSGGGSSSSSMLTGRNGKREEYDSAGLVGVRFEDSSGRIAEYGLAAELHNWTLLEIVAHCMGGDLRNNGSGVWLEGHCPDVGTLRFSEGIVDAAEHLRIGVGAGTDPDDWILFALQGRGRLPHPTYAFGTQAVLNPGFSGQVFIHGVRDFPARAGMWTAVTLPCTLDGEGCVLSPNFPQRYSANQKCVIRVDPFLAMPLNVTHFETEARHDVLTVDGRRFSGSESPNGVLPVGAISWKSDHSVAASGWRLCPSGPSVPAMVPTFGGPYGALKPQQPPALQPPTSQAGHQPSQPPALEQPTSQATPATPPSDSEKVLVSAMFAVAGGVCAWLCVLARRRRRLRCEEAAAAADSDEDRPLLR